MCTVLRLRKAGLVQGLRDGLAKLAGPLVPGHVSLTAQASPTVTLSKSLTLCKPQFLHLENGDGATYPEGPLESE